MVELDRRLDSLFGALSDPTRRAIVARLARGPTSVTELAEPFEMSLAAVSKHLQVLDRAGLVERTRQGRSIQCSLQPAQLKTVADWITDYERFWTARLAALEQVIKNKRHRSS
jgi:DNA-binding transcriptional ArsR family regulator